MEKNFSRVNERCGILVEPTARKSCFPVSGVGTPSTASGNYQCRRDDHKSDLDGWRVNRCGISKKIKNTGFSLNYSFTIWRVSRSRSSPHCFSCYWKRQRSKTAGDQHVAREWVDGASRNAADRKPADRKPAEMRPAFGGNIRWNLRGSRF